MKKNILIIDDEEDILRYCKYSLGEQYGFLHARNGKEAQRTLSQTEIAAALLDRSFHKSDPGELLGRKDDAKNEGIVILKALRSLFPTLPIIIITHYGEYSAAKEALLAGATDFIEWGALATDKYFLQHYLQRAIGAADAGADALRQKYNNFGIIGSSPPLLKIFSMIEKYKNSSIPVLIQGASGTGKELVAHALHKLSERKDKPFVKVNCGALPESLVESELFGHKKGAFTDAHEDKKGMFETAHEGTLFLDEVGNLGPTAQAKLLRVLESGEIRRIGETASRKVNVRIISATNAELDAAHFRQDLYWRLNGVRIVLPTLKERKEDIGELAAHFINKYNEEYGRQVHGISAEALNFLKGEDFLQNNVRELEILIKRCVTTGHDIITLGDMVRCRDEMYRHPDAPPAISCSWLASGSSCPLMDEGTMEDIEKAAILRRYEMFAGQKEKAAKSLGIGKSKLYQKLKEYGKK